MPDPTVNIKIDARVEIGEMRKVEEALQREIVQLQLAGKASKELEEKQARLLDIRKKLAAEPVGKKYTAAIGEAAAAIPGVGSLMAAVSGSAGAIAAGVGVISGAFGLAAQSIRAFAASEVEMAKLDAALANSGKLTDEYREKLSRLATVRSQATAIDDEKYIAVLTTLTKFGADTTNIDSYLTAVENLAGFLGGDMEQAAFLFGKAMTGSTEMLGRYGIEVDKSKSQTEQLQDIMLQLQQRGGGQLEAMAATLTGSFTKVQNAWENMLESMGSLAEKSGLANYIERFAEGLQIIAGKFGGDSAPKAQNRQVFVAANAEQQVEADKLTNQRSALEKAKRDLVANNELRSRTLGDSHVLGLHAMDAADADKRAGNRVKSYQEYFKQMQQEEQMALAANEATIESINTALAYLLKKQGELGLDVGTPEQAAAARKPAEVLGPAFDDKAKAAAERSIQQRETDAAKREELALELQIAEAKATGNKAEATRLQWIKDYTAKLKEAQDAGMGEDAEAYARRAADAAVKENKEKKDTLDLEIAIAEAKAAGNQKELQKLEWLKEYNALLAQGYREDQAQRGANAFTSEDPKTKTYTKSGDLFAGTNRRRGAITSDAFEGGIDAGTSLLDQYKANRNQAVGSVGGQSILENDPKSSGAEPIADAAKKMEDLKTAIAEAGASLNDAVDAAKEAGGEAKGAASELSNALSSLKSDIAAIKRASSGS